MASHWRLNDSSFLPYPRMRCTVLVSRPFNEFLTFPYKCFPFFVRVICIMFEIYSAKILLVCYESGTGLNIQYASSTPTFHRKFTIIVSSITNCYWLCKLNTKCAWIQRYRRVSPSNCNSDQFLCSIHEAFHSFIIFSASASVSSFLKKQNRM